LGITESLGDFRYGFHSKFGVSTSKELQVGVGIGGFNSLRSEPRDKLLVGKSIWAAQAQRHGLECNLA